MFRFGWLFLVFGAVCCVCCVCFHFFVVVWIVVFVLCCGAEVFFSHSFFFFLVCFGCFVFFLLGAHRRACVCVCWLNMPSCSLSFCRSKLFVNELCAIVDLEGSWGSGFFLSMCVCVWFNRWGVVRGRLYIVMRGSTPGKSGGFLCVACVCVCVGVDRAEKEFPNVFSFSFFF